MNLKWCYRCRQTFTDTKLDRNKRQVSGCCKGEWQWAAYVAEASR